MLPPSVDKETAEERTAGHLRKMLSRKLEVIASTGTGLCFTFMTYLPPCISTGLCSPAVLEPNVGKQIAISEQGTLDLRAQNSLENTVRS